MMKYFYIILCVTSMFHITYSQNKEALENWLYIVESEFPEFDRTNPHSLPRSGSAKYNQIRFNLLSDSYFRPVFGKSITELNASSKGRVHSKIKGLINKKTMVSQEHKYPWAKRLDWYLWGALTEERLSQQINQQVISIKALRLQYNQQVEQLSQGNIEFNALTAETKNIDRKYAALLPSEIKSIKQLIEKQTTSIANNSILKQLEELKNLPVNYNALMELHNFKNKNKQILSSADLVIKNQVERTVDDALNAMLTHLVSEEKKNVSTLSIAALNSFSDNFSRKYSTFSNTSQVKQVTTEISNLKAQKVLDNQNTIENNIQFSEDNQSLQYIENTYLSHINLRDHPNVASLSQKITQRKKAIIEEQKLRLEQQKQAQKQAEIASLEKFGFTFSTEGLQNPKLMENIFKGNFKDIPFNRDDLKFGSLITQFMLVQAKTCPPAKSNNTTEILETYCARTVTIRDGNYNYIREECDEKRTRGTGLYTSKALYAANNKISALQSGETYKHLGQMLKDLGKSNPYEGMTKMAINGMTIKSDIAKLVQLNGCNNTAIQRFEENLIKFSYSEPAIKLDGSSELLEVDYTQNQDIHKLFKDLVLENSKSWVNDYISGSISGIKIISRDAIQRPLKMTASYKANSFFGVQTDQVDIRFENGVPKCIDFPKYNMYCKTPDRRVVANFITGAYVMH